MKLLIEKNLKTKVFFLDIPGDHYLFGSFEKMMRDNFVFNDPCKLSFRIFKPVSRKKYGFNLMISLLEEEVQKFELLIQKFCKENEIEFHL